MQSLLTVNGLLSPDPLISHSEGLGNTPPGPFLSGAVARATMATMEPTIWASAKVAHTCNRDKVWRRIIPRPTPWMASSTPSQSHKHVPLRIDQEDSMSKREDGTRANSSPLTSRVQQHLPKGRKDRLPKHPTTFGTIVDNRDRQRRPEATTSGSWSSLYDARG